MSVAPTTGTPALWPTLVSLRSRFTFRYSADGRYAAAITTDGRGTVFCERWTLHGTTPSCVRLPGWQLRSGNDGQAGLPVDAVPFADGSVLVVDRRELTLLGPDGAVTRHGPPPLRPEVVAPAPDGSARVLLLGRPGTDLAAPGLAWSWAAETGAPAAVAELPALLLRGGGWLDVAGDAYAVNLRTGHAAAYLTASGEVAPLPMDTGADGDLVWLTAPDAGTLLSVSTGAGQPELRVLAPGRPARTLRGADGLTGKVTPLLIHPSGNPVVLHEANGLRDRCWLLNTRTDTLRPVPSPEGQALSAMAWMSTPDGPDRLWGLSVSTGLPARIIDLGRRGGIEVDDGTPAGSHRGWAPSRLEHFPGAGGDIEAIVCGHDDWRTARQVVIALHGGPASLWNLKFSPLFQLIAAEGGTVIAANPRGSLGYGDDFHRMIVGAWGGPDLRDVLALARHVRRARGGARPALYGSSYGGYLALLAAGAEPGGWDAVLAVAPMLSGESLYADAAPPVRAMIDRLGGRHMVVDDLGARDVAARAGRIAAPLLIVHGDRDDRIPIGHSRRLVRLLTAAGRRPGEHFRYVEVPGGGHTPLDGSPELHSTAARFLVAAGSLAGLDS